jgi:CelD/BcsL family acetyltransferase involved in cellulose biosynthesis
MTTANPLEHDDWDAQLENSSAASFFHSSAWAKVLQGTYGYHPVYFTLGDSGCLRTLLPFMEVDSWLTGRRGISLPFTDECTPICPDADTLKILFQEAIHYADKRAWRYLECRGSRPLFGDAPASTSYLGHQLELHDEPAALFSGFSSSSRRSIRKAEQSGLEVKFSQEITAARVFYRLLCQTRRKHGVPPPPYRFFLNLHRHVLLPGQGCIVLAYHGTVPVAGAVFLHFAKTAIYKYGASDESFQNLRPNNLVIWQAIQHYAQLGYRMLDFGRTSIGNDGLRKFKLAWGATERRIDYIKYDRNSRRFVVAPDKAYGWHNRLFRTIPTSLSRLIGAMAYKHIA